MNSLNRYSNQYKHDNQRHEQKKLKTFIKHIKQKTMNLSLNAINCIALTIQGNGKDMKGVINKCEMSNIDRKTLQLISTSLAPYFELINEVFKIEDVVERQKELLERKQEVLLPSINPAMFETWVTTPFEAYWLGVLASQVEIPQPSVEVEQPETERPPSPGDVQQPEVVN